MAFEVQGGSPLLAGLMNLDARHNLGQRTAPSAVSVPPRQVSLLPPKYAWWPPTSGARNIAVEVYGVRASGKHKI